MRTKITRPAFVVALSGGLGNQMFQYAMGRSLAIRHAADLLLDIRMLQVDPLRSYALDAFAIGGNIASSSDLPPTGKWANRILRRLPRWLRARQVTETSFTFDPAILNTKPPARLLGNWQSERYFADVAEAIRQDFVLKRELTPSRQLTADAIAATSAVSVHVRRGDYVTNAQAQAYHGSVSVAWYDAAVRTLAQKVPNAHFVVFSDDPLWARQNLSFPGQATFVPVSEDGRDWEDMHLMSLCRHHIIANSSFSWWGAWLNARPDKIVIAPKQWFNNAPHDTRDLIPMSWTRL